MECSFKEGSSSNTQASRSWWYPRGRSSSGWCEARADCQGTNLPREAKGRETTGCCTRCSQVCQALRAVSQILIRAALEGRLKTLDANFQTAWDNIPFQPKADVPYQMVSVLFATPDNPVMSAGYRELGYMMVALMYPIKVGSGPAATKAKTIRDYFPKGLSLTNASVIVTINRTAAILSGVVDGDRWRVPIRIDWYSNMM